jgi:hypothetical protein
VRDSGFLGRALVLGLVTEAVTVGVGLDLRADWPGDVVDFHVGGGGVERLVRRGHPFVDGVRGVARAGPTVLKDADEIARLHR